VARESEDGELRFARAQHAGFQDLKCGGERCAPGALQDFQEPRLLGDIPVRVAGARVRQDSHALSLRPVAEARAGESDQVLDHGGAVHLEEEVVIGLFGLPAMLRLFFQLGTRADGDEDRAVSLGIVQRLAETRAGERGTVETKSVLAEREALALACVEPGAAVFGIPGARPLGQLVRTTLERIAAWIAEEARIFVRGNIDGRGSGGEFQKTGQRAHGIASTGLNWQPSTKKSKK
jgi:hypothetical protein